MDRGELEMELERLRDATSEIEPDERMTDAILAAAAEARPEEDPLASAARRTSALDPGEGLTDAVMERAAREVAPFLVREGRSGARGSRGQAGSWLDGVVRAGPVAVGLAAALAAACFALFLSSQSSLDVAVATSFDAVEVAE